MKAKEIVVGKMYIAKVSGNLVPVRVDRISEVPYFLGTKTSLRYHVTNMKTRRKLVFQSAAKFRREHKDFAGTVDPIRGEQ